ncbi:MAG: hypothetical protein ABR884_01655 [Minisyncoccia bacterium]|jgi:hypothetical protein
MKREQISSQDGPSEPQIPQQRNFDFEGAAKKAAVEAKAIELRKVNDWTLPYARAMASQQLKKEEWEEKASQKEKSN